MRLTHEEAIRNVLQNPQLSKAAIRLYLMLTLTPSEEIRYLTPELVSAVGCTESGMLKAAKALVSSGLVYYTGKGKLRAKIIVEDTTRKGSQERDLECVLQEGN